MHSGGGMDLSECDRVHLPVGYVGVSRTGKMEGKKKESDQFRFLHSVCLGNLKGSAGLILVKGSTIRISIPLDLSSRTVIQLPRFIRSRIPTPLLVRSLVFFPPCSD
jgi:hypothetical protein